mmetsp:Transcript_66553/g.109569  ORF Transcript_66553/g.109569 Transcript_66553/m.109569 type:complete len:156 (+) Transcript_66553:84-551(+)
MPKTHMGWAKRSIDKEKHKQEVEKRKKEEEDHMHEMMKQQQMMFQQMVATMPMGSMSSWMGSDWDGYGYDGWDGYGYDEGCGGPGSGSMGSACGGCGGCGCGAAKGCGNVSQGQGSPHSRPACSSYFLAAPLRQRQSCHRAVSLWSWHRSGHWCP